MKGRPMKSRFLEKIRELTDSERHKRHLTRNNIRLLIEKLESRYRLLNQKISLETDPRKLNRMQIELHVLKAQKNKGMNILKHS
ncbi:MAG: hypothetical protein C0631_09750 [Sedimenticola sp.]|nr:MAG: hypothetical protein C0631_09750 [Sedimenticola sp.]